MFQRPSAGDAGQYRCNIRNDQGETNANLSLNFQQDEERSENTQRERSATPSRKHRDRSSTPSRRHKSKSREGSPKRHKSKSREGSPKKSVRSRPSTPTQEEQSQGNMLQPESAARRASKTSTSEAMEVDQTGITVLIHTSF